MKRIAILDDYQNAAASCADWSKLRGMAEIVEFREHFVDEDSLIRALAEFEVVIANRERTPLPGRVLAALSCLELIVTFGMRNASIDRAAAERHGIWVCGTQTLGHPTVELTWALILALSRNLPCESQAVALGRWQSTIGRSLRGKRLGVLGLGRIGTEVARIGAAFGMEVIGWSRRSEHSSAGERRTISREQIFRESDVLTLHLSLNDATRRAIGDREFALMKPDAILVNTARSELIDQAALIRALEQKRLGGFACDVFEEEPTAPDHPLTQFDHVLMTPHLGYVVDDNYRTVFGQAVEDVLAWLDGTPIRVIVPGRSITVVTPGVGAA